MVTYSDSMKQTWLGVEADTLVTEGAVSAATVQGMVRGVLRQTDADVALAISGVAGPGGGSSSKPVGTVWIALGNVIDRPVPGVSDSRENARPSSVEPWALPCSGFGMELDGHAEIPLLWERATDGR